MLCSRLWPQHRTLESPACHTLCHCVLPSHRCHVRTSTTEVYLSLVVSCIVKLPATLFTITDTVTEDSRLECRHQHRLPHPH